jgi:hypothetical protein
MIDEERLDEWLRRFSICISQLKGGQIEPTLILMRLQTLLEEITVDFDKAIVEGKLQAENINDIIDKWTK